MNFFVVRTVRLKVLIVSIRRELLDTAVVMNERHLRRLIDSYVSYYKERRVHRSLAGDAPDSRPVCTAEPGKVAELPAVSELYHYYLPAAA